MTRAECAQATALAPSPLLAHARSGARTNTHAYTPANQRANRFQRQSDRQTSALERAGEVVKASVQIVGN